MEDLESFDSFMPYTFMACLQRGFICSLHEGWRIIFPVLSLELSVGTELTGDWAEVDVRMGNPRTLQSLPEIFTRKRIFGSHVC